MGVISGFRRGVTDVLALLGCYATFLQTFQNSLSVPSSRDKQSKEMGPKYCPETSVITNQYSLTSKKSEYLHYLSHLHLKQ